jgi:hypothetical protein
MKILFTGSIPTFQWQDTRELSDQEKPFGTACEDMGFVAASRGHTILLASDHQASTDYHVMQGVLKFASQGQDNTVHILMNRPEGSALIYDDLPANIIIQRKFHPEMEHVLHGTLIPCVAALDASDVMVSVGGKLTAKLMGHIAADRGKGLLAIPSFGGSSAELYESMKYLYKNALSDQFEDLSLLRSVWSQGSAEKIINLTEALAGDKKSPPTHSYFISYVWEDSALADHVEVLLRRSKRVINRDESIFRAGTNLSDVVQSLINESDTFVALWNDKFKNSTWCPNELAYAIERQHRGLTPTRVILLALDDTQPPIQFTGKLWSAGQDRTQRELTIRKLVEEE